MEDEFMRQARSDFSAAGRPWPPFQQSQKPARFWFEEVRSWLAFNQGFGWLAYWKSFLPNLSVSRRWPLGERACFAWSFYGKWHASIYRMTATDGSIAVSVGAGRFSFWARVGFPDPSFAERKRAELRNGIDATWDAAEAAFLKIDAAKGRK